MGSAHSDLGVAQADLEHLAGTERFVSGDELLSRIELCEISAPRKGTREALDKVRRVTRVRAESDLVCAIPVRRFTSYQIDMR